jgi:predicted amidohydrolase
MACLVGDVPSNLRKLRDFCVRAREQDAELIVFPEMADTGYVMRVIREHASAWTSGVIPELRQVAKTLSLAIVCGVSERAGDAIYNSQVVIGADGELLGKYRKTHLFSPAPIEEDKCFAPGDCTASFSLGEFRFGLSICYDLRFPEVYRLLTVDDAANVLTISSAWPFPRVEHLRVLATARAIENQSYVVLSNRVGTDDGITFCGSSMIIDAYGMVVAGASADREELVVADISLEILHDVRERAPYLEHRRRDLY